MPLSFSLQSLFHVQPLITSHIMIMTPRYPPPPSLCSYIICILPKLRFILSSEDTLIRVRVLKSILYSRGWLAHDPHRNRRGLITVQDTMIIIIWIILYGLVIFTHGGTEEVVVVLNIFTRGFMAIRSTDNG